MKPSNKQFRLAVAAGLLLAAVPSAYAAPGTGANTLVTNTVLVDYSVGSVAQTQLNAASTFRVDRKINIIVAEDSGAAISVVPNSTENVMTFTVTNETNDIQDFRLTATEDADTTALVYTGTDNFDTTLLNVFVEDGTTAGYQSAEDTATFIDELAAGANIKVYVVGDIDAAQVNGDKAGIRLTAFAAGDTTTSGTGAYTATVGTLAADEAETNTGSANNAAFVDTVFADTNATNGNTAENGAQLARGQYNVVTAAIVVTKSSTVVSDPINSTTNPKAIPGATIEYCIDVENTGAAAAGSISIADAVPANTTYVAGSIKSAAAGAGTACTLASGTAEDDNSAGADETDTDGGNYNGGSDTVTVTTPTIGASSRFKASFRVTVD